MKSPFQIQQERISRMKHKGTVYLIILGLIFGSLSVWGDAVSVENAEKQWFYYIIDPGYLANYDYEKPDFNHYVIKFFNEAPYTGVFNSLAPGQVRSHSELGAGTHLLVGFFVPQGSTVYSVKTIQLTAGSGDRRYVMHNTASNISVIQGSGLLSQFKPEGGKTAKPDEYDITVDNKYGDWASLPAVAGFSSAFNPVYFNRELRGETRILPIDSSLFWTYGGTSVKDIKALLDGDKFYLYLSCHREIEAGLIYYLYLFKDRKEGTKNQYTLELDIRGENRGKIYVWEQGVETPVLVGSLAHTGYFLEAEIDLSKLPVTITAGLKTDVSFDLTSCFYDSIGKIYEEFFFTTIQFKDIPVVK